MINAGKEKKKVYMQILHWYSLISLNLPKQKLIKPTDDFQALSGYNINSSKYEWMKFSLSHFDNS